MMPIAGVQMMTDHGYFMWLLMGLISGWLTGKVMSGHGYGVLHDIVLGLIGAFVGGYLAGLVFDEGRELHFWGSLLVAFIGGCIVVGLYRKIRGNRPPTV